MSHPLSSKIKEQVSQNKVVIYMKGTPEFPQCGFSRRAVQVLREAGSPSLVAVDVLADEQLWDALEEQTQWPTVPQVFINGEFIGGCDITVELFERGELQKLLSA